MPGWQGSTRHATLPPNWAALCMQVMERDRRLCQHVRADTGRICGLYATDTDHIGDPNDHRLANLRALCPWHHLRRSGAQGGKASGAARRAKRDAAKPLHPGLIPKPQIAPQRRPPDDTPPPF
jgi:5-methylcytosine-specific restriction protein A